MKNFGKIQKISVPDSDMQGWLRVLREGGLSEEEIDQMMVRLNKTYKEVQGPIVVDREVERIKKLIEEEHKYHLNDEQEQVLRKNIERVLGVIGSPKK